MFVGLSFIYAKKKGLTIKYKRAAGECIIKLVLLRPVFMKKSIKVGVTAASLSLDCKYLVLINNLQIVLTS